MGERTVKDDLNDILKDVKTLSHELKINKQEALSLLILYELKCIHLGHIDKGDRIG